MTERTIKAMAKELAGAFYEQNRSPGFRRTFPTPEHYFKGVWVNADGSTKTTTLGWQHHVVLARKVLTNMLRPEMRQTEAMKERIFDALIEDHNKATGRSAKHVTQRVN